MVFESLCPLSRGSPPAPPAYSLSLVLLQCLLLALYRMVLPVLMRIHCGMGRFCFNFLASFVLMRKVLWADCKRKRKMGVKWTEIFAIKNGTSR